MSPKVCELTPLWKIVYQQFRPPLPISVHFWQSIDWNVVQVGNFVSQMKYYHSPSPHHFQMNVLPNIVCGVLTEHWCHTFTSSVLLWYKFETSAKDFSANSPYTVLLIKIVSYSRCNGAVVGFPQPILLQRVPRKKKRMGGVRWGEGEKGRTFQNRGGGWIFFCQSCRQPRRRSNPSERWFSPSDIVNAFITTSLLYVCRSMYF